MDEPKTSTESESRQMKPIRNIRPQPEKEREPDAFQRQQEKEGRSNWSGGWAGGGVINGRDRER